MKALYKSVYSPIKRFFEKGSRLVIFLFLVAFGVENAWNYYLNKDFNYNAMVKYYVAIPFYQLFVWVGKFAGKIEEVSGNYWLEKQRLDEAFAQEHQVMLDTKKKLFDAVDDINTSIKFIKEQIAKDEQKFERQYKRALEQISKQDLLIEQITIELKTISNKDKLTEELLKILQQNNGTDNKETD